ncbi:hypothetical protein BROC_01701 [Candidatus Brocadiaceae bacterium]|nr:hypothetical protein BROC_01701 [Candidatus Brocadiaceae bacterium]
MKKGTRQTTTERDDMRPEYDFKSMKGGVRGKYFKAYRAGHTVKIQKADGTTAKQYFKLEEGAVLLEPDVRKYFPNSETVNEALRGLISLLPKKHRTKVRP